MTHLKEVWVLSHFDYYKYEKGKGYQPTEKATPEAREALEKLNEYNLKKYGKYIQNPESFGSLFYCRNGRRKAGRRPKALADKIALGRPAEVICRDSNR